MKKSLSAITIKDADQGLVEAVFSTFGVIDRDGDVTVKEAFSDGAPVVISAYGHRSWDGELPVGKGFIRVTDSEAILDGQFFLNTTAGRDTFETVKQLAADGLGEWSYGLMNVVSERTVVGGKTARLLKHIDVPEVSPVLVGASIDTRTLSAKSASGKQLASSLARLLASAGRERWGRDAWWVWVEDYDVDAGFVVYGIEGRDGDRLVQVAFTRTDTAVELGADEVEVIEVDTYVPKGVRRTFSEHAGAVVAAVDGLITRASEVVALRAEKGKSISDEASGLLAQLDGSLGRLKTLIDTPPPSSNPDEAEREFLRFVALSQGVTP